MSDFRKLPPRMPRIPDGNPLMINPNGVADNTKIAINALSLEDYAVIFYCLEVMSTAEIDITNGRHKSPPPRERVAQLYHALRSSLQLNRQLQQETAHRLGVLEL